MTRVTWAKSSALCCATERRQAIGGKSRTIDLWGGGVSTNGERQCVTIELDVTRIRALGGDHGMQLTLRSGLASNRELGRRRLRAP
jgi:hypothetical protein